MSTRIEQRFAALAREGRAALVTFMTAGDPDRATALEILRALPAAGADYPLEEFTADLLRLDRQPDTTGSHGRRFELGGSTGRKGGKRLSLFDETGEQHDYYAIRFIVEQSNGRADHANAAAR